ncbi:MAG: L-threonylcarbamoyladenylate synthase [Solirubrobacteraceae bacterium]|nr:L-threonylcarbamoyladenylate synthase [Solirubrobacteraceae bacterium]
MIGSAQASEFERCVAEGGVAVFPADTVYGLACRPDSASAIARLYALKGRQPDKPAAVMFFAVRLALAALPELGPRTRRALEQLLPGAVTLLVDNPADRFPLACPTDPSTLGLRVPRYEGPLAALAAVREPVLQSSANVSGGPDARRLEDVPEAIGAAADLVLDGGELPGTPSTVIDLRGHEDGAWSVVREGAVDRAAVERALGQY